MRELVPIERLLELYASGLSTVQVAKAIGTRYPSVVNTRLRRHGVVLRNELGATGPKRTNVPTSEWIALYESGMTGRQIASKYGVNHKSVQDRLIRAGVKLRKRSDYPAPSGPKHHLWRGGRTIDEQGYVWLNTGPRRPRRPEHRVVMEQHIGRTLEKHEHVRIENLAITDVTTHEKRTLIRRMEARIRELEQALNQH